MAVIDTVVSTSVTLGSSGFASPLTVTSTGTISPTLATGAPGIVGLGTSLALVNDGTIMGGGADLHRSGSLSGTFPSYTYTYTVTDYTPGGTAVSLDLAVFSNAALVAGGRGPAAGDHGAGVYLIASTGSNSGVIEGGAGYGVADFSISSNGAAAPGVVLSGGYFSNSGVIMGGVGLVEVHTGGAGITLTTSASLQNHGLIEGGVGTIGGIGIALTTHSTFLNYGTAAGGNALSGKNGYFNYVSFKIVDGAAGGNGGDGAIISDGIVFNDWSIIGGTGGAGGTGDRKTYPSQSFIANGGMGGAGGIGVYLGGGTLTNDGLIAGGAGGLGGAGNGGLAGTNGTQGIGVVLNGGVLIDHGTIAGGHDAISFTGTGTLQIDNNAIFDGAVRADPGAGDVLLASAASNNTIWIGREFFNFATLDLEQSMGWTVEGNLQDLAGLTITGLNSTETLKIYGVTAATESYVPGAGLAVTADGTTTTLAVEGGLNGAAFETAPCFCRGTRIRTPRGEAAIEDLRIGDEVSTAFGGVQRIKWIGRRDYEGRFIRGNHLALPVCIKAEAIDAQVPARDLWVSPDHGICEGGVIVRAWRLVNGVSIVQPASVARVSYLHLELDAHHVIFAEDCPTESFLDAECRDRFHNAADYKSRFGPSLLSPPCLPLVQSGFHLQNIIDRLAARAGLARPAPAFGPLRGNLDRVEPGLVEGWAQDISAPERPVALEILADGQHVALILANQFRTDLRAAGIGSGCHAFATALPPAVTAITVRRASDHVTLASKAMMAA